MSLFNIAGVYRLPKSSEFGKGFAYSLGLFLAHAERKWDSGLWFNAAADHLFELQAPWWLSKKIKARIKYFKDFCIERRLPNNVPEKDKTWAIQEAKDLLLMWDKARIIDAAKGDWE